MDYLVILIALVLGIGIGYVFCKEALGPEFYLNGYRDGFTDGKKKDKGTGQ